MLVITIGIVVSALEAEPSLTETIKLSEPASDPLSEVV